MRLARELIERFIDHARGDGGRARRLIFESITAGMSAVDAWSVPPDDGQGLGACVDGAPGSPSKASDSDF